MVGKTNLHLEALLLVLDPASEGHLGLKVLLQHSDLLLVSPHRSCRKELEPKRP